MSHHFDSHQKTNANAIQETDAELTQRIRSVELIKHMPNLFYVSHTDANAVFQILGGTSWLATTLTGAAFGYWYYAQRVRINPTNFYSAIMLTWPRVFLGAAIGGYIGYLKFGDRQRLHNAWVAERLRRRYPDSMNLEVHDVWKYKGIKANHPFYRWT